MPGAQMLVGWSVLSAEHVGQLTVISETVDDLMKSGKYSIGNTKLSSQSPDWERPTPWPLTDLRFRWTPAPSVVLAGNDQNVHSL